MSGLAWLSPTDGSGPTPPAWRRSLVVSQGGSAHWVWGLGLHVDDLARRDAAKPDHVRRVPALALQRQQVLLEDPLVVAGPGAQNAERAEGCEGPAGAELETGYEGNQLTVRQVGFAEERARPGSHRPQQFAVVHQVSAFRARSTSAWVE